MQDPMRILVKTLQDPVRILLGSLAEFLAGKLLMIA